MMRNNNSTFISCFIVLLGISILVVILMMTLRLQLDPLTRMLLIRLIILVLYHTWSLPTAKLRHQLGHKTEFDNISTNLSYHLIKYIDVRHSKIFKQTA